MLFIIVYLWYLVKHLEILDYPIQDERIKQRNHENSYSNFKTKTQNVIRAIIVSFI